MTAEKKYKDRQAVLQNSRTAFFHAFKEVTGGKERSKTARGRGEGGGHPHKGLFCLHRAGRDQVLCGPLSRGRQLPLCMDALQVEASEFELIRYPERGTCLYRCGNERYLLQVIAPAYKSALFGAAGGR